MERKMTLIRRGKWSICFKYGNVFVKEYIYPNYESIEREMSASKTCWDYGIYTPKCLGTKVFNGKTCVVFEHCDISPINPKQIINNSIYLNKLLEILSSFNGIIWNPYDLYWHKQLIDFKDALSYIKDDTSNIIELLTSLNVNTFIHGDFTCDNIGLVSNKLIVFDFQHGSLGPFGWDKAYFAATITPENINVLKLNDSEKRMAFAIAAIRYGRAIRKSSSDLTERKKIYLKWKQKINI